MINCTWGLQEQVPAEQTEWTQNTSIVEVQHYNMLTDHLKEKHISLSVTAKNKGGNRRRRLILKKNKLN